MTHWQAVTVSVPVGRSPAECWVQLQDLSVAHHYVPGLTATDIVSAHARGEGAHRRVYSGSRYLEETVTEWRENEGFTLRLHRGARPMAPFRQAEFDYVLMPAGEDRTRVALALRIEMPGGATGRCVARVLLLPAMRHRLRQVAAGLKHFYETGQPASDADRRRLAGTVRDGADQD